MGSIDTLKGNLMIDTTVTPMFNQWNGPTANQRFSLFTGRSKNAAGEIVTSLDLLNEVGSIRSIDNGSGDPNTSNPYAWLNEMLYTGGTDA